MSGSGAACGRGPMPAALTLHQLLQVVRVGLPLREVSMTNFLPLTPTASKASASYLAYVSSSGHGLLGPSFLPSRLLTVL